MQNFPIELFALSFISERYNFPIFVWLVIFCFCWLLMNTWFFSCLQNLSDLHFLLINIHKKKKNILISVCTITLLNVAIIRNTPLLMVCSTWRIFQAYWLHPWDLGSMNLWKLKYFSQKFSNYLMHGINRFGLSCPPSKSPLPKAHDQKATKKCPWDKSPQNIIRTSSFPTLGYRS